jgi:hypothetical protein
MENAGDSTYDTTVFFKKLRKNLKLMRRVKINEKNFIINEKRLMRKKKG